MSDQEAEDPILEQARRRSEELAGSGIQTGQPAVSGAHPVIDWGEQVGGDAPVAEPPPVVAEDPCGAVIPLASTGEAVVCTLPEGHGGDHYNHDADAEWTDDDSELVEADGDEPPPPSSDVENGAQEEAPSPVTHEPQLDIGNVNEPGVESRTERAPKSDGPEAISDAGDVSVTITTSGGTEVTTDMATMAEDPAVQSQLGKLFDPGRFESPELRLKTRDGQDVNAIRLAFGGGQDLVRVEPGHVAFVRDAVIGEPVKLEIAGHIVGVSEVEDKAGVAQVVKIKLGHVLRGLEV
jgi:hypothetical protein